MVFDPCSAGFLMGPQNRQSLGESLGQFLGESLRQVLASSPFLKPLVQMCYVSCIKMTYRIQWLQIPARLYFLWALKT